MKKIYPVHFRLFVVEKYNIIKIGILRFSNLQAKYLWVHCRVRIRHKSHAT